MRSKSVRPGRADIIVAPSVRAGYQDIFMLQAPAGATEGGGIVLLSPLPGLFLLLVFINPALTDWATIISALPGLTTYILVL